MDLRPTVSVVRCEDADNLVKVKDAVLRSLDLIGGLKTILRRGDQVLIKPNLLAPRNYKSGATTNPHIVAALIDLLREVGAKRIVIGEGAAVGHDTGKAFDECGFRVLATNKQVELVDFKKSEFVPMSISNGRVLRRIRVPRELVESDVIINVPVMKTHDVFPATLGLKNMKGIIPERDKKRFHTWGLSQCIVDLNKVALPQVTVIDGTIAMEGMGPAHGTPVNLGILISSFDTVAADTVASLVMGIDPESIEYLRLASEQGLGCGIISEIEVRGLQVEEVKRKFSRLVLESEEFLKHGIRIIEEGACSGCRNTLSAVFSKLVSGDQIQLIGDTTFVLGQDAELLADFEGRLFKFGSCTKLICPRKGKYIPGCPPHPEDVMEYVLQD